MKLLVSIVNWNTRDALGRCLRSLEPELAGLDAEVVVVDNASTDGSAGMVRREFPDVRLIARDHNAGFAAANNQAMADTDADFVLILNPDIEVESGAVRALVDGLLEDPGVAAVSPVLLDDRGEAQTALYRRFPDRWQILLFWTAIGPLLKRSRRLRRRFLEHDLSGPGPIAVDQLPGAALLIRADALADVGLMDPDYFIWFEDVDWCYRARRRGWRLHVLTAARMRHRGGASFAAWSTQKRVYQFYRAFFRFLCKYRREPLIGLARPLLAVDLRVRAALLTLYRLAAPGSEPVRLDATRRGITEVVEHYRRGRLVAFQGAEPDAPVHTTPLPPPAFELERRPDPGPRDPLVDVVVVCWNAREYLPRCLESLEAAEVPVHVIVVDNASDDGTADYVRGRWPDATLLALDSNLGYAAGANRGLAAGSAPYALVMNPDVRLERGHLRRLARHLDADPAIGAAQGRLYRVTREAFLDAPAPPSEVLDSAGHVIRRSRRVLDRGEGEPEAPEHGREGSVFSACGAALFLRRTMLDDLPGPAWFDESFFAYKEDIDLCWRARLLGWDVRYVPDAVAWHVRGWAGKGLPPKRRLSLAARRHSWKNHYLLVLKNDRLADMLAGGPWLAGWELVRLAYAVVRDPAVLPAYSMLALALPRALRQRRSIMRRRRATALDMRRWFRQDVRAATPSGDPAVALESRSST